MAASGTTIGTVIRWDDDRGTGLVEAPDLPEECWVDAAAVDHSTGPGGLRAGQVVELHWTETGPRASATALCVGSRKRTYRPPDASAPPGGPRGGTVARGASATVRDHRRNEGDTPRAPSWTVVTTGQ